MGDGNGDGADGDGENGKELQALGGGELGTNSQPASQPASRARAQDGRMLAQTSIIGDGDG